MADEKKTLSKEETLKEKESKQKKYLDIVQILFLYLKMKLIPILLFYCKRRKKVLVYVQYKF